MKAKKAGSKYDEEELEILQAIEAGTLKAVADSKKQIKVHRSAAQATFKKTNASTSAFPVEI
jgi:hypothetical protein